MKAQILTDFIIECTAPDNKPNDKSKQIESVKAEPVCWVLHVDGASNA